MTPPLFVHGTGARGESGTFAATPDGQEHITTFGRITDALGQRQPE